MDELVDALRITSQDAQRLRCYLLALVGAVLSSGGMQGRSLNKMRGVRMVTVHYSYI